MLVVRPVDPFRYGLEDAVGAGAHPAAIGMRLVFALGHSSIGASANIPEAMQRDSPINILNALLLRQQIL